MEKLTERDDDRGWSLHLRDDSKQFELCCRVERGRWRKHRVPRKVGTEANAEKYAPVFVAEKKRTGTLAALTGPAIDPANGGATSGEPTFESFATEWITGKLHRKYPDHVRVKRSSADDKVRVAVLSPAIGAVPLARFKLDDAERAMCRLDELRQRREDDAASRAGRGAHTVKPLSPSSRRQYAQLIHRVLAMAVYPARIATANPLPRGFLPKPNASKAILNLYPDEDAKLAASAEVPLGFRILFAFLAREGMRAGEALALTWSDLDLKRGTVTLRANKTDDPRAWALSPGVSEALDAWKKILRGRKVKTEPTERVFVQADGTAIGRYNLADNFRVHLRAAGVERRELHGEVKGLAPIRAHDLAQPS